MGEPKIPVCRQPWPTLQLESNRVAGFSLYFLAAGKTQGTRNESAGAQMDAPSTRRRLPNCGDGKKAAPDAAANDRYYRRPHATAAPRQGDVRDGRGCSCGGKTRKNLLGKRELLHLQHNHPLATAEEHECACSCGCCLAASRRRWGPQAPLGAA